LFFNSKHDIYISTYTYPFKVFLVNLLCKGEGRNVYRVLVGKPEGKRTLERPRRRWEDGIKMDLRQIGWGGVWSGFT
jgi:hypothetical protein